MKKILFYLPLIAAAIVLTSCSEKYKDTTLYQINGRAKPIVAILPVIDGRESQETMSSRGVTWDISKELTEGIRGRLSNSEKLYVLRDGGNIDVAQQFNTVDCRQISRNFSQGINNAEFIVVTELVNQQEKPYNQDRFSPAHSVKGEVAEVLSIDFRVKVVDMREATPKIVLQEVIHANHLINKPESQFDYSRAAYGSSSYIRTPMGVAHHKLVREVTGRIENYIRATKG